MGSVVPVKSCEAFALPTWRSYSNASGQKGLYSDLLHSPLMFHQEPGKTVRVSCSSQAVWLTVLGTYWLLYWLIRLVWLVDVSLNPLQ